MTLNELGWPFCGKVRLGIGMPWFACSGSGFKTKLPHGERVFEGYNGDLAAEFRGRAWSEGLGAKRNISMYVVSQSVQVTANEVVFTRPCASL